MDEQEKQAYRESYQRAKEKGVPFFPNALFKDAIVSLLVFLVLVALAALLGAPLEAHADPSDTSYTPRPEWYFMFLFQLLKYFPGQLEVVGVFVLPTLAILLLLALPFLDRGSRRHFSRRAYVVGATAFLAVGVVLLTAQAMLEAPPPAELAPGDPTAALYTENCSSCHGPRIAVPEGANLHQVIAQGRHEGMPAWSADLTSDEIDALAGFILSPAGSVLFVQYCGECHQAPELVAGDPLELKQALELGPAFAPHQELGLPDWRQALSAESQTALLNFLVAPDGQRLFTVNCAACHGRAVAVSGDEAALRALISQGGLHLEMPPWRERLSDTELASLSQFVVAPASAPQAQGLYDQHCSVCHGERIPVAADPASAQEIIASGGSHQTMPVWGDVLTAEQLDALVSYTLQAASGSPLEIGQRLFSQNCAACHGEFGEGGPNPARAGDIIAPISSSEYLRTRDDATLRAVISAGQPNFGMSPFGTAFGGPLDEEDVSAIVAYLRSWEANPPVDIPPDVPGAVLAVEGAQIFAEVCAQCHGAEGLGGIGPSLADPVFQAGNTDQGIFDTINLGHEATPMIGWGEILSSEQIQQLVEFIRGLAGGDEPSAGPPSFAADVLPILQESCAVCHGTLGGWDSSSHAGVVGSGAHGPAVIPGDPQGSLLAQKLLGTQAEGAIMPPAGGMPQSKIQIILDWIAAGAPDN
ncbi:MAG TPA: c-type cytochrome [Anaerolineales bacterium]|nr:c-type cytochrome [Anaerolineales bacterium]